MLGWRYIWIKTFQISTNYFFGWNWNMDFPNRAFTPKSYGWFESFIKNIVSLLGILLILQHESSNDVPLNLTIISDSSATLANIKLAACQGPTTKALLTGDIWFKSSSDGSNSWAVCNGIWKNSFVFIFLMRTFIMYWYNTQFLSQLLIHAQLKSVS